MSALLRGVLALLAGLALAACSGKAPTLPGTMDGGTMEPMDAGDEAGDSNPFIGAGTVRITWTVGGMPPAMGCAAAGATQVRLVVGFGGSVTLPCTVGEHRATDLVAGTYNISADLLDAMGGAIYRFNFPTDVVANQTVEVPIAFEPPGSLTLAWTVNGMPAADGCMAVNANRVRFRVGLLPATVHVCSAGRHRMASVQPGSYEVVGELFDMEGRRLQILSTRAMVRSGASSTVNVEFATP